MTMPTLSIFFHFLAEGDPSGALPRSSQQEWNNPGGSTLDDTILQDAAAGIAGEQQVSLTYDVRNHMRSIGARVAGAIADKHTDAGLRAGSVALTFKGSAGQSFGAFCVPGMSLTLHGEAQDYVAKCMTGGEIVVLSSPDADLPSEKNVLIGNTCLYGATGGSLFVAGQAGERFAVRNSGAEAVVEGAGDHCCEYMTRGVVAVLGEVGHNFGAGMAAGIAYVLDEKNTFSPAVQSGDDRYRTIDRWRRHQYASTPAFAARCRDGQSARQGDLGQPRPLFADVLEGLPQAAPCVDGARNGY